MRRTLATLLGAFALTGALSLPAHAEQPAPGGAIGLLGVPLKATSEIGPFHLGELPLLGRG
ncbi:hypothetical protein [Streptomyces halobius]|uniref:Small secreted domain DUF320 n=1 Tax=Streptomyces halobius TaxID=2879846 RepID=A0ABY4MBG7_9ACTN|nr:hypothetical protein [Streptomyces halobius]UQA95040.1 hypothetical protein K9S39_27130 [Streptomyces halobius]